MAWPWNGTDTLVDAPSAAPADTQITLPAAFLPVERDFSDGPRSTSEAVQPDDEDDGD